ncbi:unnamed protein product [Linum tenue]|uniref:Uncharacterized protein n=1 Tax=Linum tenue TaxID=586396 RepID=A0AAV0LEP0_9ROSI|nr:unnamed protein product [Linum tenue]
MQVKGEVGGGLSLKSNIQTLHLSGILVGVAMGFKVQFGPISQRSTVIS